MLALSSRIYTCQPTIVRESATTDPLSIVFVIDHSGSMAGTDPNTDRFRVTTMLLDSIYRKAPHAEVGIVVFANRLAWDARDNPIFQRVRDLTLGYDSYFPLTRLSDPTKGITSLRWALQLKNPLPTNLAKDPLLVNHTSTLNERTPAAGVSAKPLIREGTDISLGFQAAKDALKDSKASKERQFIIFLSDGAPQLVDRERESVINEFRDGRDVPTTFTVYFTGSSGGAAPQSLITMNQNLRNNGYSTTNPASNLWTIQTNPGELLRLLTDNILRAVLEVHTGEAEVMRVNGVTALTYADSRFSFNNRFPLQALITPFSFDIKYTYTSAQTGARLDTTVFVNFVVKRQAGATPSPGINLECRPRPTLDLFHNGSPVSIVNETMSQLEVRFVSSDSMLKTVNATVSSSFDAENYTLSKNGAFWAVSFPRTTAAPAQGDRTLQHAFSDSIIAVYRNPALPLDTLRIARPFRLTKSITLTSASYFDRNADGLIDSIFVAADGQVSSQDLTTLREWITLPSYRGFGGLEYRTAPGGFSILVTSNGPINTGISSHDKLIVRSGMLPHGGWVHEASVNIVDKMAPVILRATGKVSSEGADTLLVAFSESVVPPTFGVPFLFCRADSTTYQHGFTFVSITPDSLYKFVASGSKLRIGDTVWINHGGGIGDAADNLQANPENRRVPVRIVDPPFSLIVRVANNPYTPGTKLPPSISSLTGKNEGVVIRVDPDRRVRKDLLLRGRVSIYDVVKNSVIENHDMVFDPTSQRLYLAWDGRNRNGRLVGTGTYLAVLEITDGSEFKERHSVRIGVKR